MRPGKKQTCNLHLTLENLGKGCHISEFNFEIGLLVEAKYCLTNNVNNTFVMDGESFVTHRRDSSASVVTQNCHARIHGMALIRGWWPDSQGQKVSLLPIHKVGFSKPDQAPHLGFEQSAWVPFHVVGVPTIQLFWVWNTAPNLHK